jgi:glycosyltransferase involved in cell wall biosynthesis
MSAASRRVIIHVPRRFVAEEWGGTETVILQVARQQQRAGAHPEILTSLALSNVRQESISGISVRRFPYCYPFFGLSPEDRAAMDKKGGNLLSLSLFKSLLTEPDVRLFHAHALKRLGGQVRTAARLRKKPFVVSLHGGVYDVPPDEREQMLKPIANKPEWGKAFGALFGSRRILDDADQVICVGQAEMELARKRLHHDRIAYLPNGVDYNRFANGDGAAFRRLHGIAPDAFLVLNMGRIDAQKNQLMLLEAFAQFHSGHPESVLVLIGPETQPHYAERLRQFITSNSLTDCVRLLPGLRNDDPMLVNAYHACNVFVLPSMHEPFGIVVLEAWSAGRPVIANRVGGLKGLVRHDENGLFINNHSEATSHDLAAQLAAVAGSPSMGHRLGSSGREEARLRYDWSRISGQLETRYQAAEHHAAGRYGRNRA